ncbi:MAG: hypothetical protein LC808_01855 [Actinobacteria bacterium]|nr:hypothetical protein [Actinomycetota bacterium]
MASLRAFAETAGMKEFRPTKREQAITALLRHLVELPLAELRATLARPVPNAAARTDEYERWVELILGRGEPPGSTSPGEQIAHRSEPEASVDRSGLIADRGAHSICAQYRPRASPQALGPRMRAVRPGER